MRFLLIAGTSLAAGAVAAGGLWLAGPLGDTSATAAADVDLEQGAALYGEYCATCHGPDLEGQPAWQSAGPDGRMPAPPHNAEGHTWHHSDRVLFRYTKLGGTEMLAQEGIDFDSGMPGFGEVLTDAQILDVLGFIKSSWPKPSQAFQEEATANDPGDT